MYSLRRWWERHGLQLVLVSLTLGTAWVIQQTQGAAILDFYQLLTRPFQSGANQEERLTNARIQELEARLQDLQKQNQQLKQVIKYQKSRQQPGIVSPVIGRSADSWWQQITLGRGSQDGIKIGFAVMAPGGLVGRVVSISDRSSRVLLISDPSSRIGVAIARSRHLGYLRGQGSNRAVMQFFDKVPNVRPGDFVVTSSVSRLFPPGLPVGRVKSVNLQKNPAPEAAIEITAPISFLEWAIVYPADK
jgi:rod shape-determining protein MreC